MHLILFDIDATLISTSGVGIRAMEEGGREVFGPGFNSRSVEYAGRLDPLIIRDLLVANGLEPNAVNAAMLRDAYRRHLALKLPQTPTARALPGVAELIDSIETRGNAALGLLTGNFKDTGCLKLRACGIDPDRFPISAWGDESPHDPPDRCHLPPVALARYRERFGREASTRHAAIIGDTPHDIRCAQANGLRSLGVATGMYSAEQLRQAGADCVVSDLSHTAGLLDWLLSDA